MDARRHLRGGAGRARRPADVGLLRRPADGERPPGDPPRLRAHAEGPLLPSPRDDRPPRAAQGGVGHARAPRGDRGREGARHLRQAGHRAPRRRGVQPDVPRERLDLQGRLGAALGADGVLARLQRSVHHLLQRVRGERVVGAQDAAPEGAPLSGAQGPAVLRALRHGPELARARAGLRGRRGSVGVHRPRPRGLGRSRPPPPPDRLDHHALDAGLQRRARGASGADVCRAAQEERHRLDHHPRRGAGGGGARRRPRGAVGDPRDDAGRGPRGAALSASARLGGVSRRGRARGDCRRGVRHRGRRLGDRAYGAGVRRR